MLTVPSCIAMMMQLYMALHSSTTSTVMQLFSIYYKSEVLMKIGNCGLMSTSGDGDGVYEVVMETHHLFTTLKSPS